MEITYKDLIKDHYKGIVHDEGVCDWCDYIRQLDAQGYYDFLKKKEGLEK